MRQTGRVLFLSLVLLASACFQFGRTVEDGGAVRLWRVGSGEQSAELRGHLGEISSLAFSPDGAVLASGSWDGTARLWDVSRGETVATLEGHVGSVTAVTFSPDGALLATGDFGLPWK